MSFAILVPIFVFCGIWFLLLCFSVFMFTICRLKQQRLQWHCIFEHERCPYYIRDCIKYGLQIIWNNFDVFSALCSPSNILSKLLVSIIAKYNKQISCILDLCSNGNEMLSQNISCEVNQHLQHFNTLNDEMNDKNQSETSNDNSTKIIANKYRYIMTVLSDAKNVDAQLWDQLREDNPHLAYCLTRIDCENAPINLINSIIDTMKPNTETNNTNLVVHKYKKNVIVDKKTVINHFNFLFNSDKNSTIDIENDRYIRTMFFSFHQFNLSDCISILCDAMKHNDIMLIANFNVSRHDLWSFIQWPIILPMLLPLFCCYFIMNIFQVKKNGDDKMLQNYLKKYLHVILILLTTPVWITCLIYDCVVTMSQLYSEDELKHISRLAMVKYEKDFLQNSTNKTNNYKWKIWTQHDDETIVFPFNMFSRSLLLMAGMPSMLSTSESNI